MVDRPHYMVFAIRMLTTHLPHYAAVLTQFTLLPPTVQVSIPRALATALTLNRVSKSSCPIHPSTAPQSVTMWPGMARRHTGQAVGMRWVACLSLSPLATLIQSGSRPSQTMKHLLQVLPLALRRCLQATVFVCQPTPLLAICRPISPSVCYLLQPIISSAILYKLGMSSCKSCQRMPSARFMSSIHLLLSVCGKQALSVPPDHTLLEPPAVLHHGGHNQF